MSKSGKPRKCPTTDEQEVILQLDNGYSLRSGCYNPEPGSFTCGEYVRLCDDSGDEVLYWDSEEWANDPVLVLGAIINAAKNQSQISED